MQITDVVIAPQRFVFHPCQHFDRGTVFRRNLLRHDTVGIAHFLRFAGQHAVRFLIKTEEQGNGETDTEHQ
ncbi:hypothetical protein D3C73_1408040 [compost metagenome]